MENSLQSWVERNHRVVLFCVLAVAVVTRLAVGLRAPRPFGYVWDLYHEAVMWAYDHGRLPAPTDCWECYPPPLYIAAGLPFYALGKLAAGGAAAGGMRLLAWASMLWVGLLVYYCDKTLSLLRASWSERLLALSLALALPCLVIGSYAAESDILLAALMAAFFYQLCLWRLRPGRRFRGQALILGALAGLSALTKYSGLLTLPTAAAVLGPDLFRPRLRRRAARDLVIVFAVASALCGWHYAGNVRAHGKLFLKPPWLRSVHADDGLRRNLARYDFLSFKIADVVALYRPETPGKLDTFPVYHSVWSALYATAWTDMTFFSLPQRQPWVLPQGYGEGRVVPMVIDTPAEAVRVSAYPAKRVPLALIELVLRVGVIPGLLALVGFLAAGARRALRPFAAYAGLSLGVYFWWILGQDSWALKAKYILFLLPVYLVCAILGLRAAARVDRRLGVAAAAGVIAAILAAQAYVWAFALS
ncbi:MAG: hypothetical protein HKL90_07990 [Elusimicrobia bacterium]|nr:hypothetical protein [Elusimicrobiota bacterium]